MSILHLALVLIVTGVLLMLINKSVPMDGKLKSILNVVVMVVVVFWLLSFFGVLSGIPSLRIGS